MNESEKYQILDIMCILHRARKIKYSMDYVVKGQSDQCIVLEVMKCNSDREIYRRKTELFELAKESNSTNAELMFCDKFIDDDNKIILPNNKIVHPTDVNIIAKTAEINEQLMKYLALHPEGMKELHWRKFEKMVAALFQKMGFTVEVTQSSKDGGKDIYIAKNEVFGKVLYVVECKQYASGAPVGVGVIRSVCGVLGMDSCRPTGGIIATTSYFSRDAKKAIVENKMDNRIFLQDYDALTELMKKVYLN